MIAALVWLAGMSAESMNAPMSVPWASRELPAFGVKTCAFWGCGDWVVNRCFINGSLIVMVCCLLDNTGVVGCHSSSVQCCLPRVCMSLAAVVWVRSCSKFGNRASALLSKCSSLLSLSHGMGVISKTHCASPSGCLPCPLACL